MALAAGSIAFTGFNADGNDNIAFMVAEDIAAGTTIYFTDNEWNGSAFNTGESIFSWTAGATVAAGTVIRIDTINGTPTTNAGSVAYVDGANKGLSNGGDTIYAYVGAPTVPTAFLAAVASDGFNADNGLLTGTGLFAGATALEFTGGIDIFGYTGPRTGLASYAAYVAALNTAANFTSQNAGGDQSNDGVTPDAPFPTDGFTTGGAPVETQSIGFAADGLTVAQAEGNAGQTLLSFTLTRTGGTTGAATVEGSFAAGTTDAADFGGTLPTAFSATFADGADSTTVTIAVSGDTVQEVDEGFSLTVTGVAAADTVTASIDAARATATGTIINDDAGAPLGGIVILDEAESLAGSATTPVATDTLRLVRLGSIQGSGSEAAGRAESITYDAATQNIFTSNLAQGVVDITKINANGSLTAVASIDLKGLEAYGAVNSVAVANGILAVAYEAAITADNGHVALYDAATGTLLNLIEVGNLPDEVTFSPDGTKILVANEGQAISPTNNPDGSVSIIDVSGGAASAFVANTIGFGFLTGSEALLKEAGLALFPGQAAGTDVEPEYISVSADGTRAYVTLQEVNAVAVIDLTDPAADRPLSILPLGSIDRSLVGNAFDASDRDGISLENFDVRSVLQPDAIATFDVAGVTYFVTANEGDARVGGLTDEVRLSANSYVLDPTAYPDAAALKTNTALGRLNVLTNIGDTDGDGDYDQIYTFGGRGISIFRQNADGTIEKVRETGGEFEAFLAANNPSVFNIDSGGTAIDDRSDNKGPEAEGVTVGEVNGRTYAFVTLERTGGVMVYDVTDPANAVLSSYTPATAQDAAPEVVTFVSAADSPTGTALVLSANEVSGTITLYSTDTLAEKNGGVGADQLAGTAGRDLLNGNGGNDRIGGFAGDDQLNGGEGNDTLDGGIGADRLAGGDGNDSYIVDNAGDVVIELPGGGADVVRTSLNSYTLGAEVETLNFTGTGNFAGTGNGLNNTIFGLGGNDTLRGLGGDDRLVGGAGTDLLAGGAGRDMLEGGAGADTFLFAAVGDFATGKIDAIRDFSRAEGDRIDVSAIADFAFIGAAGFSGTGGAELRYAAVKSSTVIFGDMNGDGIADFSLEVTSAIAFAQGDFVL